MTEEQKSEMKWCILCRTYYGGAECMKCAVRYWKSDRQGGCLMVAMMLPFAAAGMLIGLAYSGLRAGFLTAWKIWDEAHANLRKPRPGS